MYSKKQSEIPSTSGRVDILVSVDDDGGHYTDHFTDYTDHYTDNKSCDIGVLSTIQSSVLSNFSESSRSTESKRSKQLKRDRDLSKQNVVSPIDLECQIQSERITKILDEALYKTRLAICLPTLVKDYNILRSIVTNEHMDDLTFIFERYDDPLYSENLLNMAAMEELKNGEISLKHRLNPELGNLLYLLNSYSALKPIVEEMAAKMKEDYILSMDKPYHDKVQTLTYLMAFERFRDLMVKQMQTPAAEELAQHHYIKKLEASNAKYLTKIAEINQTLKTEQASFVASMSEKQEIINQLEEELSKLNEAALTKLKKKVLDSDRQMVLMTRDHVVKTEMLKEEDLEIRERYNKLLNLHLTEEKKNRDRRAKVESQQLSLIHKYDTEMMEKQAHLDELELNHKKELAKIEEFTKLIKLQDLQYIPLMAEREAEYEAEMLAKMTQFRLEHYARIIQKHWRQAQALKAEKRKLRNLSKKKISFEENRNKQEEVKSRAAKSTKAANKIKKAHKNIPINKRYI